MSEEEKYELTNKEKKELRKVTAEMLAVFKFLNEEKTWEEVRREEWFIPLTYRYTTTLVKHSNILNRLTRWLIGLTITLVLLTGVHIFLIFNATFKWF